MKLTVDRELLLKPLQQVAGVVERRQTLPILSNVLIKAEEGQLSLTGTDLEVELIGRVSLEMEAGGEVTVPARKLLDICRELPEGATLELSLDEQRLTVKSGRFRSTLSTLPATDFPNVETSETEASAEIDGKLLKRLIDKTAFAMAQQDVRYFLNGMLLEVTGGFVRAVATDGHRLAMCTAEMETGLSEPQQVIVPRKGVLELQRLLNEVEGSVKITLGSNHLCAENADFTMTTKLVDGRFPDYDRVIPKGGTKEVMAEKLEFRQALNRTAIFSNEKFRGIRVQLSDNQIQLSANNPEQEEAEEAVSVEYQGDTLEIGFNVGYLQDVLGVLESDKVKITLHDSNSSALLEDPEHDDALYVVMPMKL